MTCCRNKYIRKNRSMTEDDPELAIKMGLRLGGRKAMSFVVESARLVDLCVNPQWE